MSYDRCLCGILPIKTGAYIVAFIDLLISTFLLPTITVNALLYALLPEGDRPVLHPAQEKYRDLFGHGIFQIISLISLVLLTIVKLLVLFVLFSGIRKEIERQCKPWLWVNVILLWFVVVSCVASAVVLGIAYNWTWFPIAIFAFAIPVALLAYLLYVIYSFKKSVQ